ncbi:MAG: four helix bundle protein [Methanoregula sp.]|jgi:four helix bundle protein|nr:four helix bundle protein [Methanoregula sp.]
MSEDYKDKLKRLMDEYVNFVYKATKSFPKEELYGSTSQWRRATLSIILNYIEGYARRKSLVQLNFFEISYGSLKESKYLLYFSNKQKFFNDSDYAYVLKLAEEIGAMLWTEISALEKSLK